MFTCMKVAFIVSVCLISYAARSVGLRATSRPHRQQNSHQSDAHSCAPSRRIPSSIQQKASYSNGQSHASSERVIPSVIRSLTRLFSVESPPHVTQVDQKNAILFERLMNPPNGNYTDAVNQYINFCDQSFDVYLNAKIADSSNDAERQVMGKIRYEVNVVRRNKLTEADKLLGSILSAGGLKQMEAKLAFHLRRAEIDMPFLIMLQLNIEAATNSGAEQTAQVMTHLQTLISENQDAVASPPVRLLRMLLRTDDVNVRKQMLRQKLLIGNNVAATPLDDASACAGNEESCGECSSDEGHTHEHSHDHFSMGSSDESTVLLDGAPPAGSCGECGSDHGGHTHEHSHDHGDHDDLSVELISSAPAIPLATSSPQCEHIVVRPVARWGGADVTVAELQEAIKDVVAQVNHSFACIHSCACLSSVNRDDVLVS
jgi:hypothetical protein